MPQTDQDFDVFMSAKNGEILVWKYMEDAANGKRHDEAFECAEEVAEWIIENGVERAMNSSSMDFAKEYGFETDDLRGEIWAIATEMKEAAGRPGPQT